MTNVTNDVSSPDSFQQTPQHGDRGSTSPTLASRIPVSLSIAISRESGARGASIARRVGEKLGWQVYTQDLLEYSLHNEQMRQDIMDGLSAECAVWVETQLEQIAGKRHSNSNHEFVRLMRMMLALAAQGEVILIGRGACHLLPQFSTLSVRFIAPQADRTAYLSEWLRLTEVEAAQQMQTRDTSRREFIETHFSLSPSDVHLYDLVINTSFVGEETSSELIVQAAKAKLSGMHDDSGDSSKYD